MMSKYNGNIWTVKMSRSLHHDFHIVLVMRCIDDIGKYSVLVLDLSINDSLRMDQG